MIHRLERREIVVLENSATTLELANVVLDVVRPEPHLRVIRLTRRRSPVDKKRRPVAALEEKVVCDRVVRQLQSHHLLVKRLALHEVARAEDC